MQQNFVNETIIKYLKEFQENSDPIELNNNIKTETDIIYKKLLELSPKIFSLLNDQNVKLKKWEFIFSPWLRYFIVSIVYKRFFYLYLVKRKINLNFLKLNFKEKVHTFIDHNDFMLSTNNLDWNFLCIKIIHQYERKTEKKYSFHNFEFKKKKVKLDNKFKRKIVDILSKYFYKLFLKKKFTYFTFPHRFSFLDKLIIFFKTNRGVYFEENIIFEPNKYTKFEPSLDLRDKLYNILLNDEDLKLSYVTLISLFLPMSKLENYNQIKTKTSIRIKKNKNFKSLFTQGSHIDNEIKLHELYQLHEDKIKINVIQHGNNYDLIEKKYHTGIDHEYFFKNGLYTWGWSNNEKEIRITSPRLMNFRRQFLKLKNKNNQNKILYVLGPSLIWNFPRSLHISHNFYNQSEKLRINFFNNLGKDQKNKIIFRIYPYKSYEGMRNFYKDKFIDSKNISKNSRFVDDVNKSSILIFDHLSTANLECASIEKPFLLFFNSNSYPLSEKGKKIIKILKDNGIYHDDYKSLSKLLIQLNDTDILNWWKERKRHEATKQFINQYAYFSSTAREDWSNLIKKQNEF